MTRPDPPRAPVNPRPITNPDHAGQLAVTVAFRIEDDDVHPADVEDDARSAIRDALDAMGYHTADLAVAVRVIGAHGEKSEMEGHYDNLDDPPARTTRDSSNVDTGGKL